MPSTTASGIVASAEAEAASFGHGVDVFFWFLERFIEITMVLVLIGVCCYLRKPIWQKIKDNCWCTAESRRRRNIKRACAKCCCCCGMCCGETQQFKELQQAPHVLVVTLICATNIKPDKENEDFFFELWPEPAETAAKNSRGHWEVKNSCDLGCEELEIDWFGDEDELVVRAVKNHTGQTTLGEDENSLCEVRVPRAVVEKYAKQHDPNSKDLSKTARAFPMVKLSELAAHHRKARTEKDLNPVEYAVENAKVSFLKSMNMAPASPEDMEELRRKNAELKQKIHADAPHLRRKSIATGFQEDENLVMKVVMHFKLGPRTLGKIDVQKYQNTSFHEGSSPGVYP